MSEPTGDQRPTEARHHELLNRTYSETGRPQDPWLCATCWNESANAGWEQVPETPCLFRVATLGCTSSDCDALSFVFPPST
jgi:hypothetical protein